MDDFFQFFKDFGNLINTTVILALAALAFKVFRNTIDQKNAELDAVKDRIDTTQVFSVDNFAPNFKALKAYYEVNLQEWYKASLHALEAEKHKALETKANEFQARIEEEIERRDALMQAYSIKKDSGFDPIIKVSPAQICGAWTITGNNPHTPEYTYYGKLTIKENEEVIVGSWEIGSVGQKHKGIGLVVSNMVAFQFVYGESDGEETGLVLYEVVTPEIMRGYWTGFGLTKIGFEECRKLV